MTIRAGSSSSEVSSENKLNLTRQSAVGYIITGIVVHGNHLGKTLGFPTANIRPHKDQPPMIQNGVYLVSVSLKSGTFSGLCNIGHRPTVGGKQIVIEVNILSFSEEIYGEEIFVRIIRAIRKEKKFENLEQLVNQIKLDKEKAIKILSALNKDQIC